MICCSFYFMLSQLGSALHFAARSANTDCVRVLLAYGANVNLLGKENGPTPVQCAVRAQSADCTRLLLEHGANMNSPDQVCSCRPWCCSLICMLGWITALCGVEQLRRMCEAMFMPWC